jgi:hypothetical protein
MDQQPVGWKRASTIRGPGSASPSQAQAIVRDRTYRTSMAAIETLGTLNTVMRYRELVAETKPRKPVSPTSGTIKPKPPMTPAQSRQEADRQQKVQKRIRNTQAACNAKVQDLRADL